MKYKTSLLTIFLIVCVLFSVSTVVASDTNETAIAIEEDDQIIEETNDEIVSADTEEDVLATDDGTFTALQNKINNANESSTIILEKDYTYDEGFDTKGILIDKPLCIQGNGHSINALSKSRIFNIDPDYHYYHENFILSNITFIGGYADNGGAIYASYDSTMNDLHIINCTFLNNHADAGGAVYMYDAGNCINCTFADCYSLGYGGAISGTGINCTIINCYSGSGGAISGTGINCTIINCYSEMNGGAIATSSGDCINCTFRDCYSLGSGGAIWMYGAGNCINCTIINCYSTDKFYGDGVIFFKSANGKIINTTFINCNSALTLNSNGKNQQFYVVDCIFINCNNTINFYTEDNPSIINCSFINCDRIIYYGVGYAGDWIPRKVINCSFINCGNDTDDYSYIIMLSTYAPDTDMLNCTFKDCESWVDANISESHFTNFKGSFRNAINSTFINCESAREIIIGNAIDCLFVNSVATGSIVRGTAQNCTYINCTIHPIIPKLIATNLNTVYTSGSVFKVTVYESNGKLASRVSVVIKVDGKTVATVKTTNGIATYKTVQTPGTYKISATALGETVTKTLTVKHLVTLKSVTVKKTAKKLVIQASLAKVNGNYLKNKKITFKFNGKKYTAKTNAKGVAKVTIKSSVLKKLKVGKKITYQATYLKDTVKKTVKISK